MKAQKDIFLFILSVFIHYLISTSRGEGDHLLFHSHSLSKASIGILFLSCFFNYFMPKSNIAHASPLSIELIWSKCEHYVRFKMQYLN